MLYRPSTLVSAAKERLLELERTLNGSSQAYLEQLASEVRLVSSNEPYHEEAEEVDSEDYGLGF